ncbi:uncharacterized protein LOC142358331 isoform X2 [Convolutriloba macropyga]
MAISMGEATRTLQQMMPDMDAEVIASVLESHGGHMERAVESLLAIGGDSPMHRSSINDHSPSRHSLALSTPSQPMASPRETEQMLSDSVKSMQSPRNGSGHSVQMDCDEMLAQSLQHEELIQAAEAHQEAVIGAFRNQAARSTQASYNLSGAIQGVSDTITSMGNAAYRGLSSLLSSPPTFTSCMPASVREQDDQWGRTTRDGQLWESEPSGMGSSTSSPWMTRGQMDAATAPQDMHMGSTSQQPVSEDDRQGLAPSLTHLVHRRGHHGGQAGGHGSAAKKND